MQNEIQSLLDQHWKWLKEQTTLRFINEWVEISTPYLDRHNDYLQIFAKKQNGGFLLTDDGYIIEDLKASGCKLDLYKRQELLKLTLAGFGVSNHDGSLEVVASAENFKVKKHNLIQAMLAVNDLFYLAPPIISSLFFEDVISWLDINDIRYTPRLKLAGKSGFDHNWHFVISKSRSAPERIVQAINSPDKNMAETLAFKWMDVRESREAGTKVYAILNDRDQTVSPNVIAALKEYDVRPVPWSKRDVARKELAA